MKKSLAALFASVAIVAVAGSSFAAEVGATVGGAANAAAGAVTSPGTASTSGSGSATTSAAVTIDPKTPFGDIKVDTKATSEAQIKAFIGTLSPQQLVDLNNRCTGMMADQQRFGSGDLAYCETYIKMKKSM